MVTYIPNGLENSFSGSNESNKRYSSDNYFNNREKLTIRQGVLSLVLEDLLKRVDFDSQSQSAWDPKRPKPVSQRGGAR
jgi:hypothetical protein